MLFNKSLSDRPGDFQVATGRLATDNQTVIIKIYYHNKEGESDK